ncbi:hypothetical protein JRI60_11250 [Archangium violaceum]|uniref:hypothetical protein n=1 Tax=Archangium violaceum TaxID=83451 RepID=UPI0019500053|nr:hypothetical protein [Archangium violaceum]QRN99551.1 hypothetical protein JRI60_11250 [Archangium violaceum]
MSVRTLLLVLSTTTMSLLAGCATTQTAPREDATASSTSMEQGTQGESQKGCGCAHHAKAQEGSAQAEAKGCGCPHCAQAAAQGGSGEAAACGCSHHDKGTGDQG